MNRDGVIRHMTEMRKQKHAAWGLWAQREKGKSWEIVLTVTSPDLPASDGKGYVAIHFTLDQALDLAKELRRHVDMTEEE